MGLFIFFLSQPHSCNNQPTTWAMLGTKNDASKAGARRVSAALQRGPGGAGSACEHTKLVCVWVMHLMQTSFWAAEEKQSPGEVLVGDVDLASGQEEGEGSL